MFRVIDVNGIIQSVGLEIHRCLGVEILPVDKEYCLIDGWNVHEEISRSLIRRHGLAGTCRMPDKSGLATL